MKPLSFYSSYLLLFQCFLVKNKSLLFISRAIILVQILSYPVYPYIYNIVLLFLAFPYASSWRLAMAETFFVVTRWRGVATGIEWVEARNAVMLLNILRCIEHPSWHRIIWPKMQVIPRPRNPNLHSSICLEHSSSHFSSKLPLLKCHFLWEMSLTT